MKRLITGAAIAALVSAPAFAQQPATGQPAATEAPAPAAAAEPPAVADPAPLPAPAPEFLTLDAGTPIMLAVAEEVSSSTHEAGDTFRLVVLNDVLVGDTVVIPRGTPAHAEITWRTGKGAFGKSGKIEFSLRSIDLGGQPIAISGDFRQEGEGNTIATGVGIIAVGVFAGFITGKRARLPVGRELMSQVAGPVQFTADGRLAPSYDGRAALASAEAATPLGQCRAQARALAGRQQERALRECFSERMD